MRLQGRSGAELGHRTFHAALDRILLVLAERQHDDLLGFANGPHAHRKGALGHGVHVALEEEAGIVLDRRRCEIHDRGAAVERGSGLVEGDMAVGADAQHLNVDAAGLLDLRLVSLALLGGILGHAVEDVGVGELDVDLLEEVLVHEVAVALVVRTGQTHVFVEVPALNFLVADLLGLDRLGHLVVHEYGGGSGGETEHQLGIGLDGFGDHLGRELGGLFLRLADYNFHVFPFLGLVLFGLVQSM